MAGGARYTAGHVERDGLVITADGPASARLFGEELARALGV
jgi:putative intracellular protease/amidase